MKLLLALLTLTLSFGAYAQNISDLEKIIGDDDMVAVDATASNIPARYAKIVNAFGIISMGCSATHIGKGYVLTAGHCFEADSEPMLNQKCTGTEIAWGVREGVEPYMISKCKKIIVAQQNGMGNDFALIKVSPIPKAFVLPEMNRRAVIGDTLTMFSHPEMLPLRWSPSCGVERDLNPNLPVGAFQHKCDTNPGSSGATILNILTLKIIGIHDGGTPADGGMNYGTYIMNSPLNAYLVKLGF